MVKKTAEKSFGELSEIKPRQNFRLGDVTWVKHGASSWWPAQVIDEASVSSKLKKKTSHDALVRLYGTCQYLYVDPWKSNMEFEMILKENNKTAMEAFHDVLQNELTHLNSPSDDDEEPVSTKAKSSGRKARKQEGDKRQASPLAKGHASAEGRDKTHKQGSVVRDKKGRKMAPKKNSGAADDSTSQLHDASASEDGTEAGDITSANRRQRKKGSSALDGTNREIKAMVRDILLGDVVARHHPGEMSYVDDVIFGICDATEAKTTHAAKKPRKGNNSNSSPSRDAAMEGSEQPSARQIKIMQKLGLVAPPGSPFKGLVAAAHR